MIKSLLSEVMKSQRQFFLRSDRRDKRRTKELINGVTTSQAYFPKDFGGEFDSDYNITEWLTQYSKKRMSHMFADSRKNIFSQARDGVKKLKVLSGGEKYAAFFLR